MTATRFRRQKIVTYGNFEADDEFGTVDIYVPAATDVRGLPSAAADPLKTIKLISVDAVWAPEPTFEPSRFGSREIALISAAFGLEGFSEVSDAEGVLRNIAALAAADHGDDFFDDPSDDSFG